MIKSASFGVVHLGVAFGISYALTGDVAIAGAITLIEPAVNTVVHYLFDRYWGQPLWQRGGQRWRQGLRGGAAAPRGAAA